MRVLTAAQMRAVDAATIAGGIPGSALMEAAGAAAEAYLRQRFASAVAGPMAVFCGGGYNGGDGLVLARRLRQAGVPVKVILLAAPASLRGDAAEKWTALQDAGAEITVAPDQTEWERARASLGEARLWVDAILGTGLAAPPRAFLASVIRGINAAQPRPPILAVDLPSGLLADGEYAAAETDWESVVRATATITFTAPKLAAISGPGVGCCGDLHVAAIGSPPSVMDAVAEASLADAPSATGVPRLVARLTAVSDCMPFLAPRASGGHKGRYGHVLLLAGSAGKSGAAAMAAEAALRAGAGLVTAAVPRSILPLVAGYRPEVMTEPLAETADGGIAPGLLDSGIWQACLASKTIAAVGPGLTAKPEVADTVRRVIARLEIPWVLDADGLNAFGSRATQLRAARAPGVLTPHPGEGARLLGRDTAAVQRRRIAAALDLAAITGQTVVLKGFRTVIANARGRVFINPTGNPGMATGGSGDVLTGILAGLWAQFAAADPLHVAAAAVYLHGFAGDLAAAELGEMPLCATDITRFLPAALRATRAAADMECGGLDLPAERL